MSEGFSMDIRAVLAQLPHRYPFLLVDRVIECVPGKRIEAIKKRDRQRTLLCRAFPGRPVMPGVMILEALAQAAGILAFKTAGVVPDEHSRFYFVGIDRARFRRPVEPGDCLVLKATFERAMRGIWKFETVAEVDGQVATSATMMVSPGANP